MENLDGFKKAAVVDVAEVPKTQQTSVEPNLTYQERLSKEGISLDEALTIIDETVRNDRYQESFKLSKSTEVILSTRDMRFTDYLNKLMDKVEIERFSLYTQMSSMNQVAASLVSYGAEVLPKFDPKMDEVTWKGVMDTRLKFAEQLAGPVFLSILSKLSKFDRKLAVIFSEGYEENF